MSITSKIQQVEFCHDLQKIRFNSNVKDFEGLTFGGKCHKHCWHCTKQFGGWIFKEPIRKYMQQRKCC